MTDDEFDPMPQDGTLTLLLMIFRKLRQVTICDMGDRKEGKWRVIRFLNDWHDPEQVKWYDGDDLKALLRQVAEEVDA